MKDLESYFNEAMFEIYRRAKAEAKYDASIFLQMLTDRGGLLTAKTLINSAKPSDGYTALFMRQRLDLTVEALVTDNQRWHSLFSTEELKRAKARLIAYNYGVK